LQARDREVRTHEQAHLSALGPHKTGGASFQYTTGPDGQQYATSGEVPVNVSPGSTPQETISKAQTIRRAALAPAEPSGADRSVAAAASQLEAKARAELNSGSATEETSVEESAETSEQEAQEEAAAPENVARGPEGSEDAAFYSGRLVGASVSAFQNASRYAESSSDLGNSVNVSA
jgi:metal-dependent amidase/aminoacylase/carboxypeptidase family protein